GNGGGGTNVYDPYAGATPQRRADAGGANEVAMLAALSDRLARALSPRSTAIDCELVVAATGQILEARCSTPGPRALADRAEQLIVAETMSIPPSPLARRLSLRIPPA
ncbi:MAG: hypothetical protein K2X31_10830, partial [Sphingopyxis sp.]|nr:hypothetical protein [Sphingopyxis sp.]